MKNLLVLIVCILFSPMVIAQSLAIELSKKSRKIWIYKRSIGLSTKNETITYTRNRKTDSDIIGISDSSIVVSTPIISRDTFVLRENFESIVGKKEFGQFRFIRYCRKQGVRYVKAVFIEKEKTKEYLFENLVTLRYPPQGAETVGCIFCILVPPYWLVLRKRFAPKTYDLVEWNLKTISADLLMLPRHKRKKLK